MMDVQTELEQKRNEYRERMERVKSREAQLVKKREELQDRLVKFFKFINENEAKKSRAEKKATAESRAKEEKHQQILKLNEDSKRLDREKQDIKVQLQKYMKYQKYLEDVLSYNEEYQDPNDIITRYNTLDANNNELQERKKWLEDEMEIKRSELQKRKKQKEDEILEHTNQLSQYQDALERTHKEAVAAQDEIENSVEHRTNTTKTVGQIRMATQNLFDRCMEVNRQYKKGVKLGNDAQSGEVMFQLAFIGDCLSDYLYIIDKERERVKALRLNV
jgi:chromosome segregation ATPase